MKVSLIAWRLFWEAFDKQDLAGLDEWLGRWIFTDDGVRLSMRTQLLKTGNSDLVVEYGETAEKSLSLPKAQAAVDETARNSAVFTKAKDNGRIRITVVSTPKESNIRFWDRAEKENKRKSQVN